MSKIQSLTQQTTEALQASRDPQRALMAEHYYPTEMEVIGVTNPDQKKVITEISKVLKSEKDETLYLEFCKALVNTGIFECQQVAYNLIDKNKTLLKTLSLKDINDLGKGLDNWVSVDTFSVWITGPAWRLGILSDDEVVSWLSSDDPWRRRTAVVSTIAWNQKSRGGTGNPEKTFLICEKVVDDRHDMVRKALSWALRELAKRQPEPVEGFMEQYWDRLPGLVRREVTNKLTTGLKNPNRKA